MTKTFPTRKGDVDYSSVIVQAGAASDVSALSAGDSVAVAFDVGRVGLQYFRGTVVRVMNARVRVKFPDVDGSCITRDVDKDKLFDIDEAS